MTKEKLYEHHNFQVDSGQEPIRIDKYLVGKMANASRTRIQQATYNEQIFVNGKIVKASYKVMPNDEIKIMLEEPLKEIEVIPEDIPIDIIYEDEQILLVNKAAGMVVHPAHGNYNGTLINALLFHHNKTGHSVLENMGPHLVHRIDKNTSGILVVAKDTKSKDFLGVQFFDHTIERKYFALVWGDFKEDEGTIERNVGRHKKHRKKYDVYPEGDYGKTAITHYKVVERFGYVTLVQCQLETGRTHQIRVHMKHIGHPLFNDEIYGGDKILRGTTFTKYKQFVNNCFKLMPRQALHAKSLGFIHPETKEEVLFESEFPEDFQAVLEKWRGYVKHM